MRTFFIIFLVSLLASCSANKDQTAENKVVLPPPHINCPEGGNCTFELLKNSRLDLKKDDIGKLYPEVTEGDKMVVKFHYKKDEVKDVMDAGLSEYVYLEFDPADQQIILKDKELQKVKMVYGRICHCTDNGYYQVQKGELFLFNKNGTVQIRSTFKVNKIRQVISQIDENINY